MGHKSNKALAERVEALPTPTVTWPRWVVTGGGVGFLRPAPGSWGTVPPAILYLLLLMWGVSDPERSMILLAFGAVASVLLVMYGKWAAAYFREPDPGSVILDEYAGFAVTIAFVPVPAVVWAHGTLGMFLFTAALYIVFRATDSLKIPPSNLLERLPWGWGVLCDDLSAGVQANLLAQLVIRLWLIR